MLSTSPPAVRPVIDVPSMIGPPNGSVDPNINISESTCIRVGGSVQINCPLREGTSPFTYIWKRDGTTLPVPTPPSVLTAMGRGNYTCNVSNVVGSDEATSWVEGESVC